MSVDINDDSIIIAAHHRNSIMIDSTLQDRQPDGAIEFSQ
jgi:hypothetical protein